MSVATEPVSQSAPSLAMTTPDCVITGKIGFLVCDMQDFGGLEEIAVELAVALRRAGNDTTVYCTDWTAPSNRYRQRLEQEDVPLVQPPKWLSRIASHWETKERALAALMKILTPVVFILALAVWAVRRQTWSTSWNSASCWLRGRISRYTSVNGRPMVARALLRWEWFRKPPQIVHIHGYGDNLLFAIDWIANRGTPVVYEEHQTPDQRLDLWKNSARSINNAGRILACSETSARGLRTVCGARRPIVVRPPLCPDPLRSVKVERREAGHDNLQVTVVARLYVTKGLSYLLQAIALVRTHHPNVAFQVYGDGELRSQLLQEARELGLRGEEIFVGTFARTDLTGIMERTDIWVSSSILEGQSVALVEAMAYGCAIVTTDAGGSTELIEHGENGMLCPQADPESLAKNICTLIESPKLRHKLSVAARRSYEQGGHQPADLTKLVSSVYQDVLCESSSR